MNKTKLSIIALGVTAAISGVTTAYHRIHVNIIVKRFPDYNPKFVRARYNTFMKDTLAGKWSDVDFDPMTAEEMDDLFETNYLNK